MNAIGMPRLPAVDRLRRSRAEIFEIAHEIKGDRSPMGPEFPRSRLLRALSGRSGKFALGSAAVAMAAMRPALVLRLWRLVPLLRPLLLRWVLPRILRP